jgi:hypothetical protein
VTTAAGADLVWPGGGHVTSCERNACDVLNIQAEVASAIAREIGGTVLAGERARLNRTAADRSVYDVSPG